MIKTIYNFSNLTNGLEFLILGKGLKQKSIAEACSIHPSYLNRALKGSARFSSQQVFAITKFLKLSSAETDYLILLWHHNEANTKTESDYYLSKINEVREQNSKIAPKMKAKIPEENESLKASFLTNYYRESLTALVHMHLTLKKYRNDPAQLATALGISETKLKLEFKKLEELKLIAVQGEKIEVLEDSVHLPEESDFSAGNHINWRLRSIHKIESRMNHKSDYHFSAIFSADPKTKLELKQKLREFIISAKDLVDDSKEPTEVYHLGFDLW